MNRLKHKSSRLISAVPMVFQRHLHGQIDWSHRLIGILGARGVGKTTLMLQRIRGNHLNHQEALYVSLDDLYFSDHSVYHLAQDFRNRGGKWLFIDEVHKYPGWSYELKRIFHSIPDLYIVYAGSSIIDMLKQDAEFCRNTVHYKLSGLSFREYLEMQGVANVPRIDLELILKNHQEIAIDLTAKFKPVLHLENYFERGYYPVESSTNYSNQEWLENILNLCLESDLNCMEGYDPRNVNKIKQLLYIIAQNTPFKPNVLRLSERIEIHRNTLVTYFFHLEKAKLINMLYPSGGIISILQKPQRVFLDNIMLLNLLSEKSPSSDALQKTFFMSQVSSVLPIKSPKNGDFEVDGKWIFELNEGKKQSRQLKNNPNAFLVNDGIEIGIRQLIPLWLFGLLY